MEKLTQEQSLNIINKMIHNAKEGFKDDGFYYLLWGWLVFAASLIHYAMLTATTTDYHWISWPILMAIGGIAHFIAISKDKKESKVETYFDLFMKYLWSGFIITLLIVIFFVGSQSWQLAYPVIILLYGLGTFVSGGVLQFRPLIIGGVLCWLIGMGAFFVEFEIQLLLLAGAILISYIIPGHLLKSAS